MEDMGNQIKSSGFEFLVNRQTEEQCLGKATKYIGWNARGTMDDVSLEYYRVYRHLKFEKSKAIIREHIICCVNEALSSIGKKLGFDAQLRVSGLLEPKDYDKYIDQISTGSLQLTDVHKLTNIWL